jgi:hypothetical protein
MEFARMGGGYQNGIESEGDRRMILERDRVSGGWQGCQDGQLLAIQQ